MSAVKLAICACLVLTHVTAASEDDVAKALETARLSATAGDRVAQFSMGALLYYGSAETSRAIEWIRRAAAQSYAPAEFQVGQLYDFGFGVRQDDRQALAWYRRSAEHGSSPGQRMVGDFYR